MEPRPRPPRPRHNPSVLRTLALVVLAGCGAAAPAAPALVPNATAQLLPPTELGLRGGGTWASRDAAGKVVVLDVWATYCEPCKKAFPKLDRLAAQFPDVIVIGVSVDDEDAVVERFLTAVPAAFTIARDPTQQVQSGPLAITKLPTLILVDRRGRLRLRIDEATEAAYDHLPTLVAQLRAE